MTDHDVAAGLEQARRKMQDAGVSAEAIDVFSHYYRQLHQGATGLVREHEIEPVTELDRLEDVEIDSRRAREALARTVQIKLNGGLGTSMGMEKAKSLLPVRDGRSFLDLIVAQVLHARAEYDADLPLLWMNSFRTRRDTLEALEKHPEIPVAGLPADFLQNQEPKLRADDLTPVSWPQDPQLEWCPPGHGDVYTAMHATGLVDRLLQQGYRYAAVSNSDNLGATPDADLAGWFAESGAPFAMEVCRRTRADRKGGHIAWRSSDGQLILRDKAQVHPDDAEQFSDHHLHQYFNTNNLWWDLEQLKHVLDERGGVLGLPLIRNTKPVDPTDPESPQVHQIETAMGAAIEVFEGATAIEVDRSRFLPVKTTNDLLVVRSDVYAVGSDGRLEQRSAMAPFVTLDDAHYKRIDDFEQRFENGAPSLVDADSLTVDGDWTFGADVTVTGDAHLRGPGGHIEDGSRL